MIILVGDIHGEFRFFRELIARVQLPPDVVFIQLGDFGYYPHTIEAWPKNFPNKVYFFDGNHEYFPALPTDSNDIVELANNLFYIPRGYILTLEGLKIGVMGGGESVDYVDRTMGIDWFPQERVELSDIAKLRNEKVDVLLTHTPPSSVIRSYLPKIDKQFWKLPHAWEDISAHRIQLLWEDMGYPQLYCGHIHKSIIGPNYRVLDINEVVQLTGKYFHD